MYIQKKEETSENRRISKTVIKHYLFFILAINFFNIDEMYLELFEIYSALKLKIDLDKIEFQHSIIFVNELKISHLLNLTQSNVTLITMLISTLCTCNVQCA